MLIKSITARVITENGGKLSLEIVDGAGERRVYRDVTKDHASLTRFAEIINAGQVSPIHIDEIVEDFLP